MMPPILKIIFIILGIAPLLRLIMTIVIFTCGMAVVLWFAVAYGVMVKSSALIFLVYSCFSGLLISLGMALRRTAQDQNKYLQWTLIRKSAVRLVGMAV